MLLTYNKLYLKVGTCKTTVSVKCVEMQLAPLHLMARQDIREQAAQIVARADEDGVGGDVAPTGRQASG
ncbi:MAG: hypothetical protein Q8807_03935, partial ['Waltheria sp.' little leaf phytoplasma]|nr:hypothetical protein ['Waltheria sp.' little leaf phytoplasma]